MLLRDFFLQQRKGVTIDNCIFRIKNLKARAFSKDSRQRFFIKKPKVNHDLTDHFTGDLFFLKRNIQLVRRDNTHGHQLIAQTVFPLSATVRGGSSLFRLYFNFAVTPGNRALRTGFRLLGPNRKIGFRR